MPLCTRIRQAADARSPVDAVDPTGSTVSIQAIPFALWLLALCGWCRVRSGHCGDGRHPGLSREGVAYRGEGVGAVLGGGGRVTADGAAVAGGFLRAESSGDLLLGLRRAQVAFGLVSRRSRFAVVAVFPWMSARTTTGVSSSPGALVLG